MVQIKTSGYTLLEPGRHALEVRSAEPVNDYDGPQRTTAEVLRGSSPILRGE
jgi:hypothetical protein